MGRERSDGHHTRRGEFLDRSGRRGVREVGGHEGAGGLLAVGRVAAFFVVDHVVVADLGGDHELVREAAAHHAGVGLDRDGGDADAFEERFVSGLHREITLHGAVIVGVERVGVHHHELAGAHESVARTDLVTELGPDLVKVFRQIAVAGDLLLHERGDDFLVSRPEDELRLFRAALAGAGAVSAKHDFAGGRPARSLLPVFGRMKVRHPQLDAAGGVQFLAADLR